MPICVALIKLIVFFRCTMPLVPWQAPPVGSRAVLESAWAHSHTQESCQVQPKNVMHNSARLLILHSQ